MWGATINAVLAGNRRQISIHAPRVGRDQRNDRQNDYDRTFQSTRPVWGATTSWAKCNAKARISIHAPRVGRDKPQL